MVSLSEEGEKAPGERRTKGPASVASETVSDCRARGGEKYKEVA